MSAEPSQSIAPPSLRALLTGSIDYAGLFPPASLAVEPALENYANYIRTPNKWMLGAFILPVSKLDAAASTLARFDATNLLRISILATKSENAAEFLTDVAALAEDVVEFAGRYAAVAPIEQIEIPLPSQPGVTATEITALIGDLHLPTFLEAPADDAERVIGSLADHNRSGNSGMTLGFKLRTGGVIASAFPSSVQIARALVSSAAHLVPIKFTAGLHHPVRHFHPSVQTKMHGFLNVLGAGVLAAEHAWDVQQTASMLEDEDPASFVFDDQQFAWREWTIATEQVRVRRKLVTSLGSCSFDEPRDDLRALKLL
jgi:hypothetical protein